jgi:serine/threonine-protein kinase RsbT
MTVLKEQALQLSSSEDVLMVRRQVRLWAVDIGFSLVDQTKIVTAASELARNTIIYGGGGMTRIESVLEGGRRGIRVIFEDKGPGIPDIEQAMKDGFTTAGGLGLGLGGAKRLSSAFEIESRPGAGTVVRYTRWR